MKKLILLIVLLFTPSSFCLAQDPVNEEELLSFINGVINGLVNANTLFTSQEAVSSGYFRLYQDGDDEKIKLNVLKIPFRYTLCDEKEAKVRPYVRGMLASASQIESVTPVEGAVGLSDFSAVDTISVSIGGGADIELFEHFTITPDFQATYSRVENRYNYHNDVSQFIGSIVDGQVFNWDLDVMTYVPSIKAQYVIPLETLTVTLQSQYSHLYNKSFSSSSDIIDIDSSTNLVRNMVQVEVPTGLTIVDVPINVRPFFSRNDLGGFASHAMNLPFFYEAGADIALKVKDRLPLLSELSVGGSYIWGGDLEGVRVGVGGAF